MRILNWSAKPTTSVFRQAYTALPQVGLFCFQSVKYKVLHCYISGRHILLFLTSDRPTLTYCTHKYTYIALLQVGLFCSAIPQVGLFYHTSGSHILPYLTFGRLMLSYLRQAYSALSKIQAISPYLRQAYDARACLWQFLLREESLSCYREDSVNYRGRHS